jgi:hypothetical protein
MVNMDLNLLTILVVSRTLSPPPGGGDLGLPTAPGHHLQSCAELF